METGYARLVANFETVTIVLNGLGASYNPNQELIKLPALIAKLDEAKAMLVEVDHAQAAYAVAVDEGQRLFRNITRFAVDIKRSAAVELDDAEFTAGLQAIVNRLTPRTRRPVAANAVETGEAPPKARSGPNNGRDSKVALLSDIIALLRTRSDYQPNDPSVTVEGIEQRIAELTAANARIREAATVRASLIERRNAMVADETTGIAKRIKLIRLHLARTVGTDSAAYRRINGLKL